MCTYFREGTYWEQIWIFTIFATALNPHYFGIYIKKETEISLEMTKQFLDFY